MNKTTSRKYAFFYTDQTKKIEKDGFTKEHYTVIRVKVFNNNVDEAERKARTINKKLNFGEMPGGYSTSVSKKIPFSMPDRYKVIKCRDNTKIQPYNDKDKFIIDLIESETGQPDDLYYDQQQKLFNLSRIINGDKNIKRDIKISISRSLKSIEKQLETNFFTTR